MEQRRRSFLYTTKNKGEGTIAEAMKSYTKPPRENDGVNRYHNVRVKPKTSGPYPASTDIEIPITSDSFTITEFDNSYLHLQCRVDFSTSGFSGISVGATGALGSALNKEQYVFIGFKSSNHVIRNYHFVFNDLDIPTSRQTNALYENFLYTNFKSKGEIANKKWVFSPYDEVERMDNSICGSYVPLETILNSDNNEFYVVFELIIPITEFLALESFDEYPNKIFGELKVMFNTTAEGIVYCQVNPIESIRNAIVNGSIKNTTTTNDTTTETTITGMSTVLAADTRTFPYTHAFQQQGISTTMCFITNVSSNTLTSVTQDVKITASNIQTLDCWCDIRGYEASHDAIMQLKQYFNENPFTVCAQRVERYSFHSGAESSGLDTDVNIRMRRVTDCYVLMPTNSLQKTVFCNPALDKFQLMIGNTRYPDQLLSTLDPEFFENQIQSTDFDSFFEATDSYEHSLTDARVGSVTTVDTNGSTVTTTTKIGAIAPITDDTGFCPIFSLERDNAGELVFDGRNDKEVKIEITGRPMYQDYNIYPPSTMSATPPPTLCTCSDTYWIFRLINGTPNCQYVTDHDYDEAYNNPDIEAVRDTE